MSPMQHIFLGLGAVDKKTYVDDVFSIQAYRGTGQEFNVVNGIDLAGKGGMVWAKARDKSYNHCIMDSARDGTIHTGTPPRKKNEYLVPNSNAAEGQYENFIPYFNNNGYTVGADGNWLVNRGYHSNPSIQYTHYVNWCFRRAKGFFDVITWTGDGSSNRQISHSLSSIPGLIIVKKTSETDNWNVYHRSAHATSPENYRVFLNTDAGASTNDSVWNQTKPTSSNFTVGSNDQVNGNGKSYVAYVFAGGESDAATARSVSFSSSSTYLSIPDSNDFDFGSTFTFEAWVKPEFHSGNLNMIFEHGSFQIAVQDTGRLQFDPNHIHTGGDFYSSAGSVPEGQWTHVAVVGTSGTLKMYINGVNDQSHTRTGVDITGDTGAVTISDSTSYYFKGEISNLRIVKGTAVYTSSFRPPYEPLTNITNTKLLCCNDSSTTGSTVTPNTITANGSPTASTDSPFDDPAGFVFGDAGDQNVIKCGSYVGTGGNAGWQGDNPVELGFVPQWVMVKRVASGQGSSSGDWVMVDQMRNNNAFRKRSHANENVSETGGIAVAPSGDLRNYDSGLGFNVRGTDDDVNNDGSTYIYIAIREAAGLVKRPPSLGTEVFTVDQYGNSSSTIPAFDSAFAVNFVLNTIPASSGQENLMYLRKGSTDYIKLDSSQGNGSNSNAVWDSNVGWGKNFNSSFCSWMWASYSGAVGRTHRGTGANQDIAHNLGQTPEMLWVRAQGPSGDTVNSAVYHKVLPSNVDLQLNQSYTYPATDTTAFNSTAPTSTHYTVGTSTRTNNNGTTYFVMLFASVDGISKVDSFDGSNSDLTVTVGFEPRFLMVKQYAVSGGTANGDWVIVDTIRGWGSGNDKIRHLNSTSAISAADVGTPTSTGFTLTGNNNDWNQSGKSYIYYAHA